MANFLKAFALTGGHEGGYANDPDDRGGETYKGIARKHFPNWRGWKIIDLYKKTARSIAALEAMLAKDASLQAAVEEFYKAEFWNRLSLDQVNDQAIANELYDTGVNCGVKVSGTFLQRTLNVLNNGAKLYADLIVDGAVGAKTIAVLNSHPRPATVLKVLNVLQGYKYISIAEANPSQEKFMNGWLNRVNL